MIQIILITAFIVFYTTRIWYYTPAYLSDYWVVEYNIHEDKTLHYAWLIRGVKKCNYKAFMSAYTDFSEAFYHKPYDIKVLIDLCSACIVLGKNADAKHFLERARENIYDESEEVVKKKFAKLSQVIAEIDKHREEARRLGKEPVIKLDLRGIEVVK